MDIERIIINVLGYLKGFEMDGNLIVTDAFIFTFITEHHEAQFFLTYETLEYFTGDIAYLISRNLLNQIEDLKEERQRNERRIKQEEENKQ